MSNPQESNRWQELIAKYLAKTITREELDNMLQWAYQYSWRQRHNVAVDIQYL